MKYYCVREEKYEVGDILSKRDITYDGTIHTSNYIIDFLNYGNYVYEVEILDNMNIKKINDVGYKVSCYRIKNILDNAEDLWEIIDLKNNKKLDNLIHYFVRKGYNDFIKKSFINGWIEVNTTNIVHILETREITQDFFEYILNNYESYIAEYKNYLFKRWYFFGDKIKCNLIGSENIDESI